MNLTRGFVTILTGVYGFQDCVHLLASIRKFHQEPILILIDRVPKFLYPLLLSFGNVILKPAPSDANHVLASRFAKLSLYKESIFEQTIYLDSDICLLDNVDEVFESLTNADLSIVKDLFPSMKDAIALFRKDQKQVTSHDNVLPTLQSFGLPLNENTIHYNSGFIAFKKSPTNEMLFNKWQEYYKIIIANQDLLKPRDQGALAAAIEVVKPNLKVLPPTYNYLHTWKNAYPKLDEPIKVLHCTYCYRPQYAKNVSRSIITRIFDKLANIFLANSTKNPWRYQKVNLKEVSHTIRNQLSH